VGQRGEGKGKKEPKNKVENLLHRILAPAYRHCDHGGGQGHSTQSGKEKKKEGKEKGEKKRSGHPRRTAFVIIGHEGRSSSSAVLAQA